MKNIFLAHRTAWIALLVSLAALWIITPLTWQYLSDGTPLGMHPLVSLVHVLLAVVAGAVAAWQRDVFITNLWKSALAGMLISILDFACQLVFAAAMLASQRISPVSAGATLGDWAAEALYMGVFTALMGAALGSLGGIVSWLQLRGYNKPAQP